MSAKKIVLCCIALALVCAAAFSGMYFRPPTVIEIKYEEPKQPKVYGGIAPGNAAPVKP